MKASLFALGLSLLFWYHTYASTIDFQQWVTSSSVTQSIDFEKELSKYIPNEINLNNEYAIDLSPIEELLEGSYPEESILFQWSLKWASHQEGNTFRRTFDTKWEKDLDLSIFKEGKDENGENKQELLFEKNYSLLVYDRSYPLIYSQEIDKNDIMNYIDFSKKDGIFIYAIGPLDKIDIENASILNRMKDYKQTPGSKSDYMIIWGPRDFLFNILSNINKDIASSGAKDTFHIVWLSDYNLSILWSYIKNFLSNKPWIEKVILLNESSKYLLLKQNKISDLIDDLEKNQQEFLDITDNTTSLNHIYFLSNFVNNLSNIGYSSNSIYLFLIIPCLLTIIIFFKHFIGISPIGISIPLFISILYLKIWVPFTLGFLIFFVLLNLILSVLTERYHLLYAPRMAFLLSINIIFFIGWVNILWAFTSYMLSVSDILFFVIFILLCEKMINIITSKDLDEYKESFFYTLLIPLFCYGIFQVSYVKVFLLSYPEVILLLIPLNFMIGRFSWLRITEYFRFAEVIKNIEE